MRHNLRPFTAAFAASALGVAGMVMLAGPSDAATATSSSASCYPASECDGTTGTSGSTSGYPAAPGVQNGSNPEGMKCAAFIGGGMLLGGAGAATAASATAYSVAHGTAMGAANGTFGCGMSQVW